MLAKFSVKKIYTILVSVLAIIILGIISFLNMSTDLLPSMEFPYVMIVTTYPGASPEKIEKTVTDKLEDNLASVSNVKNIKSISSENASVVMMEFNSDSNMDSALIEINSKINVVEASWTDNLIGTPVVTKINPNIIPIMITSIDLEGSTDEELADLLNTTILPAIEKVNGVASVTASGVGEKKVVVTLDQEKIDKINKKILNSVNKTLSKTNTKLNSSLKEVELGIEKLNTTETENLNKIANGKKEIKSNIEMINSNADQIKKQISVLNNENSTLKNQIEVLNNDIAIIENNFLLTSEEKEAKILEKELEIAGFEEKIYTNNITTDYLNDNITTLTTTLSQLIEKEEVLEESEYILVSETSKIYSSLLVTKSKVEEGITKFESTRDEALKSANIDSLVNKNMISTILNAENFSMPAGYIDNNGTEIVVKVGDKFSSVKELEDLTLFSYDIDGLRNIKLKDVSNITLESKINDYVKVNNENGVILTIQKQSDASTSEITNSINTVMNTLKKETGISVTNLMDQGIYIDYIISSVLNNLLYGAILAIIVLLLFLKDYRPTLTVAVSIPISLMLAVVLMYFSGVTINIISLSGLALGVGMLVDNSIVVIENIYRLKSNGVNSKIAAINGTKEVASAITASTLTTICVFLPIIFVTGITKQIFTDMGLTIAYSLLASLLVSLTVIPAISSGLFKKCSLKENKLLNKVTEKYSELLNTCLNKKTVIILTVSLLFAVSIGLASTMGTEFIPEVKTNQMTIKIDYNDQITKTEKYTISEKITEVILSIEDVEKVGAIESSSVSMLSSGGDMNLYLTLKEDGRKYTNSEIKEVILSTTKDFDCELDISTSNMDLSMLSSEGIEVIIKSNDDVILDSTEEDIKEIFNNIDGVKSVSSSNDESADELSIVIDKNSAMKKGLTVAGVYSIISSELKNEIDSTVLEIDGDEYQLVIKKDKDNEVTIDNIKNIVLNEEKNIKVSDVANIGVEKSDNSIMHINQSKYISVSATLKDGYKINKVSEKFEKELDNYEANKNVTITVEGENETINQALKDILSMIALAVVLIYLIMVAQFQSLKYPFIVMFTIPLAITGGILALFICNQTISLVSMIGFLMLCGIVVNNAIVFIDCANNFIKDGLSLRDALLEAGKTRLKPILMTSLTTIFALITMAFGVGMGTEMVRALAITTIGGLLYSTILTLLFIPVMYELISKKTKIKK